MKKLFFILTILIFSISSISKAEVRSCSDIVPSPSVEFYTSYGELRYDFSKDKKQITEVAKKYGNAVERGLFASGLAVLDIKWEIAISTVSRTISGGKVCVVPVKINFYVGYSNPIIYVDKNLKKGGCKYNVVKRHEQTHHQINKSTLDYFIPLFKQGLSRIITEIPAVEAKENSRPEANKATTLLTQKYTNRISPLVDVFKNELLTEQGKLDNHTNYEFESSLCN